MTIPIPPYVPSFKPVPQVTPFTYRDGVTMLNKLDGMVKYLNKVIVPFVNTDLTNLGDQVESDIQDMLDAVNAAIDSVINSSVEVQDPVVAGIFNNPASATRGVTDLLYGAKSAVDSLTTLVTTGRLSQAQLDLTYAKLADLNALVNRVVVLENEMPTKADKSYVDAADTTLDGKITGVSNRVATLETLTNTGRLSQSELDARYVNELGPIHVVAIGSSNSVPDTNWLNDLASDNGWVAPHNYSVGGGGFTATGSAQFLAQINAAIADTSFDKSLVRFVFICDMGNDIRATNSVSSTVAPVVQAASNAYPNARIILLPAMWGNADDNLISARIQSISQRYNEASEAGLPYPRFEIINWSWTWNWNDGNWMKPGEVHMNPAGYTRNKNFVQRYLNGMSTDSPLGWTFVDAVAANVSPDTAYLRTRREGNNTFLYGPIDVTHNLAIDTDLANIRFGYRPQETVYVPVTRNDRTIYTVAIYANGLIRTFGAMPSDRYHFDVMLPTF